MKAKTSEKMGFIGKKERRSSLCIIKIRRMKILLTNDDGIQSEITRALYESLKEKHEVTLIAPEKDKSGQRQL